MHIVGHMGNHPKQASRLRSRRLSTDDNIKRAPLGLQPFGSEFSEVIYKPVTPQSMPVKREPSPFLASPVAVLDLRAGIHTRLTLVTSVISCLMTCAVLFQILASGLE